MLLPGVELYSKLIFNLLTFNCKFANSYADQNERNFKAFTDEISNGNLKTIEG